MRPLLIALAALLAVALALPTTSAAVRETDHDVALAPGSSLVVPYEKDWGRGFSFEFEVEDDGVRTDVYVVLYAWNASAERVPTEVHGEVLSGSTVLAAYENITKASASWDAPEGWKNLTAMGVTIVIDNVDGPSPYDATSTMAVEGELIVRWNEDQPVDLFLTVFCCGTIVAFVAILMWVFVRYLFRRPPRAYEEREGRAGEGPRERSPTSQQRNPPIRRDGTGKADGSPEDARGGRPLPPPPPDDIGREEKGGFGGPNAPDGPGGGGGDEIARPGPEPDGPSGTESPP
ncbi:MAG: hypothetical protein L0Z54_00935 [Thermoplasmata archaeon]|nr:hypothetical protein [Thermoplasmata archaeon]